MPGAHRRSRNRSATNVARSLIIVAELLLREHSLHIDVMMHRHGGSFLRPRHYDEHFLRPRHDLLHHRGQRLAGGEAFIQRT